MATALIIATRTIHPEGRGWHFGKEGLVAARHAVETFIDYLNAGPPGGGSPGER
jgi:seryl-tRNA(Sec) selenium transferase